MIQRILTVNVLVRENVHRVGGTQNGIYEASDNGNNPGGSHVPSLEQQKDGRPYKYIVQYCWS